ncbi:MAG: prepilin peptidase [Phycisphaerae bacterium]|nr:prepilin peptidase [Phycisphaerae bacterium]
MLNIVLEIFLWLFGLCIGSFLNVVVYRLAIGLSLSDPRRSFCPRCRTGIAWYDNLPVLSWLLLRGRCRHCQAPISVQYPLVEAMTGLVFVLVYHLLFVSGARADLGPAALPADLPLLLAWLALAACLMACSAMDIVSYTVDVRVTNVVLGLGILLHAVWPRPDFFAGQVETPTAAAAMAAFLVGGIVLWWTARRSREAESEDDPLPETETAGQDAAESNTARLAGKLGVLVFVLLTAWLVFAAAAPSTGALATNVMPVAGTLLAMFAAVVLVGGQQRAADEEIHSAIEEERPHARRAAWHELKWLSPMIVVGVFTFAVVDCLPLIAHGWERVVGWTPGGDFRPLAGVVFAIRGAVIGAAAGWLLRIVFTLIYGREAFGIGDIYILAAAGAAGGWDIALLGLILSVGIALAGWLLGLLLKRTVMIPFGPWLALGFLLALWWNQPAENIVSSYADAVAFAWERQPHLLAVAGGLMLIGAAAAIALSRLVRRWVG